MNNKELVHIVFNSLCMLGLFSLLLHRLLLLFIIHFLILTGILHLETMKTFLHLFI